MHLLVWNEDLSVGITSLDDEHKVFITLLNKLYEAIQFGKTSTVLQQILDELVTYTVIHFEHEEEYMVATQYPDFEQHRQDHEAFREKLMHLQSKSQEHLSTGLSNEIFAFMKDWFTHHILNVDKALAVHLKQKGIS
ncbi:MAG: bacteriohemerythrin [Alphaproteobacteria bacterium]|nr:bacteriohemerythrin [Alphaproteobacteria bacterium]